MMKKNIYLYTHFNQKSTIKVNIRLASNIFIFWLDHSGECVGCYLYQLLGNMFPTTLIDYMYLPQYNNYQFCTNQMIFRLKGFQNRIYFLLAVIFICQIHFESKCLKHLQKTIFKDYYGVINCTSQTAYLKVGVGKIFKTINLYAIPLTN